MRGLKLCSLAGYLALLRAEGIYGSSTTQDSASVLLEPLVHPTGPVNGLSLAGSVEPTAVEARGEDNDSGSSEKSGLLLGEGAYVYSTAGGETSFLLAPLVRREGPAEGLSVEPTAAEAKSKETASGDSGASEEKSDTPYISVSFLRGDTAEDVTEGTLMLRARSPKPSPMSRFPMLWRAILSSGIRTSESITQT